jgi:hypothetical protein
MTKNMLRSHFLLGPGIVLVKGKRDLPSDTNTNAFYRLAMAEMRLVLARVLWEFDFELLPESNNWFDQKSYFLWEKKPLMVKLESRY